jgi:hypothetical protein
MMLTSLLFRWNWLGKFKRVSAKPVAKSALHLLDTIPVQMVWNKKMIYLHYFTLLHFTLP